MTNENPLAPSNKKTEKSETSKPVNVTSTTDAKEKVNDIEIHGNPDLFVCIAKVSSKSGKWMKSTKVMEIKGVGCVVQVSTQINDNVSEAVTFVPGTMLIKSDDGTYSIEPYKRKSSSNE